MRGDGLEGTGTQGMWVRDGGLGHRLGSELTWWAPGLGVWGVCVNGVSSAHTSQLDVCGPEQV